MWCWLPHRVTIKLNFSACCIQRLLQPVAKSELWTCKTYTIAWTKYSMTMSHQVNCICIGSPECIDFWCRWFEFWSVIYIYGSKGVTKRIYENRARHYLLKAKCRKTEQSSKERSNATHVIHLRVSFLQRRKDISVIRFFDFFSYHSYWTIDFVNKICPDFEPPTLDTIIQQWRRIETVIRDVNKFLDRPSNLSLGLPSNNKGKLISQQFA